MQFGVISWYGMSHQSQEQDIMDEVAHNAEDQPNSGPISSNLDTSNNTNALDSQLLGGVAAHDDYEYHWLDVAKSQHNGPYNDDLVEEVKAVYAVFGFLPFMMIYWVVYAASTSLFYSQGCQMDYYIGSFDMPIGALNNGNCIAALTLVPLLDRLIYPWLKESACNFGMLRKIGVGYFILALAMITAGLVEIWRKETKTLSITSTCDSSVYISELSILWQLPQYLMIGATLVFTYVVSFEFFSSQAPKSMKGIIYSFNLLMIGFGYLTNTALSWIVDLWRPQWIPDNLNDGHLEYFFFLMAAIMMLTILVFIPCARWYTYAPGTDSWGTDMKDTNGSEYMPIGGLEIAYSE